MGTDDCGESGVTAAVEEAIATAAAVVVVGGAAAAALITGAEVEAVDAVVKTLG